MSAWEIRDMPRVTSDRTQLAKFESKATDVSCYCESGGVTQVMELEWKIPD